MKPPSQRVHFVGVSGTGMGALAMLFRQKGYVVTGSDTTFDPPIGPALKEAGVICLEGFDPKRCGSGGVSVEGGRESFGAPDLIVVGNAIRKDNLEAAFIRENQLPAMAMSEAIRNYFLVGRTPLVVAGTHGKTTTSALAAWLLYEAGLEPGFFIGGLPKNFDSGAKIGSTKRKLVETSAGPSAGPPPFVLEGDEYDAVYWKKEPKFFDYIGVSERDVVLLTNIEHDHIDIYPDEAVYIRAFEELVKRVPPQGRIVADASWKHVVDVCKHARCEVSYYALEGDNTYGITPTWLGVALPSSGEMQSFELFGAGTHFGKFEMRIPGVHNVRNAIGALAASAEGFHAPVPTLRKSLARFDGVRRRQDLLGTPGGVFLYDDFAHHPTAVMETLKALRAKHPAGKLFAVFEPRSATACRSLHQDDYAHAFGVADRVLFAPLGRSNIPEGERLDLVKLAHAIGTKALATSGIEEIISTVVTEAKRGDTVALLSNGAFGGIHKTLLGRLDATS